MEKQLLLPFMSTDPEYLFPEAAGHITLANTVRVLFEDRDGAAVAAMADIRCRASGLVRAVDAALRADDLNQPGATRYRVDVAVAASELVRGLVGFKPTSDC